ncbi:hypothetical protein SteCoe_15070 [Stentor coeruleus]|uniref:RING-type domain-containing protein n=1 Tax=Stentor coeruleus TaxID=5963 RepID=A0A1R2C4G1_9CILI|nr:hypothetical protein SteCoe_15070 [Stentor coeruleus]
MFCDSKCLFCDYDQVAKVNYSFYHGVCEFHKQLAQGTVKCSYCKSNVPVILIIDVIMCNFCGNLTPKRQSSCGHFLCNACSVSCKLCQNSSLNLSFSIHSPINNYKNTEMSLEHTKDSKNKNLQMLSLSTESLTTEMNSLGDSKGYRKCEYCEDKNTENMMICGHYLCEDCSKDKCSLCSLLGATKFKTQTYNIHKTEKIEFVEKEMKIYPKEQNKVEDKNRKNSYENITFNAKKNKHESTSSVSLPPRKKTVKTVKVCNYCFANLGPKRSDCNHYMCKDCDDTENCKLCRLIGTLSIKPESDSSNDNHSPRDTLRNTKQEEEIKADQYTTQLNFLTESGNSESEIEARGTGYFPGSDENLIKGEPKNLEQQHEEIKHGDRINDKKIHEINEEEESLEKQIIVKNSENHYESGIPYYEKAYTKEPVIKPKKETIEGDSKCCCIIS